MVVKRVWFFFFVTFNKMDEGTLNMLLSHDVTEVIRALDRIHKTKALKSSPHAADAVIRLVAHSSDDVASRALEILVEVPQHTLVQQDPSSVLLDSLLRVLVGSGDVGVKLTALECLRVYTAGGYIVTAVLKTAIQAVSMEHKLVPYFLTFIGSIKPRVSQKLLIIPLAAQLCGYHDVCVEGVKLLSFATRRKFEYKIPRVVMEKLRALLCVYNNNVYQHVLELLSHWLSMKLKVYDGTRCLEEELVKLEYAPLLMSLIVQECDPDTLTATLSVLLAMYTWEEDQGRVASQCSSPHTSFLVDRLMYILAGKIGNTHHQNQALHIVFAFARSGTVLPTLLPFVQAILIRGCSNAHLAQAVMQSFIDTNIEEVLDTLLPGISISSTS